jgi:hypothetical protein
MLLIGYVAQALAKKKIPKQVETTSYFYILNKLDLKINSAFVSSWSYKILGHI